MGQNQSKDELLYHQVSYGNIGGIRSLHREGAGLEWIDNEGKTALIVACLKSDYIHVAKTLIELGANINAYRPGHHAGTPLHHAAKRGLEQTVKLLLSFGANATAMNDDCQTPLDLARAKGHTNVVRSIESHICTFSGWLRELNLPSFLGALAPQWASKKIWVVIIPCASRNLQLANKFELAIYSGLEIAQPRTVIRLWKTQFVEPNFNQADPALVIFDKFTKAKFKFSSGNEGDKQQLQWFYSASIGMHQVYSPAPAIPAIPPVSAVDGIHGSTQSGIQGMTGTSDGSSSSGWGSSGQQTGYNGWDPVRPAPPSKIGGCGGWVDEPSSCSGTSNGWGAPEAGSKGNPPRLDQHSSQTTMLIQGVSPVVNAAPSAPPIPDIIEYDGPVQYPIVDSSPIDVAMPHVETKPASGEQKEDGEESTALCVICLDAPKEGACVPCGHVVGCMSCLNDVKSKGWGCPVCRTTISQVIKLYTV